MINLQLSIGMNSSSYLQITGLQLCPGNTNRAVLQHKPCIPSPAGQCTIVPSQPCCCAVPAVQRVRNSQYRNYYNLEEEVIRAQPGIDAEAVNVKQVSGRYSRGNQGGTTSAAVCGANVGRGAAQATTVWGSFQ